MPMLFQMFTSCILLTLTGYQVSLKPDIFSLEILVHFQHVMFIFAELLFYCHRGEMLKTEVCYLIHIHMGKRTYFLIFRRKIIALYDHWTA